MSWLQLTVQIPKNQSDTLEAAMMAAGAVSITMLDAEDQPILEPGPSETPLWDQLKLVGLFDKPCDGDEIIATIKSMLCLENMPLVEMEDIEDQDWERAWLDDFKPMCFADKLWVYPSNHTPKPGETAIILDPGLAFGTGTHPTTAMCLAYLAEIDCHDKTVIDYGCGSGILAIAALKLGASHAICVDNDPQALTATLENAKRNNIDPSKLTVVSPVEVPHTRVDILVANILAGPLQDLAETFSYLLKHSGKIALSGILAEQGEAVLERYKAHFEMGHVKRDGDWVRLDGVKEKS